MKYFYLFILGVLFVSCQNEEFFEQIEDDTSLSSQGELSNLVSRLNQNPTAFDDFIDNSNSLSLEFPFEVTINSAIRLNITQFTDYQRLINELSALPGDYDLSIGFPVEASLPNYESVILQNKTELDAVIANVEGSSEIKCLSYNFPIEINIFDTENAVSTGRKIQNEAQFYNLIKGLKQNNGFYEIIYPVSVSIEGDSQVLTSNTDLNTVIQNLDEDCFNPSLLTNKSSRKDQFIAFVTSGEFKITQYIDDRGENETVVFENFRFKFNSDNTISIEDVSTNEVFTGDWSVEIDDDNNQLVFDLDPEGSDALDELDEDWKVEGFANPTRIILRDPDNAGENTILIFEKI